MEGNAFQRHKDASPHSLAQPISWSCHFLGHYAGDPYPALEGFHWTSPNILYFAPKSGKWVCSWSALLNQPNLALPGDQGTMAGIRKKRKVVGPRGNLFSSRSLTPLGNVSLLTSTKALESSCPVGSQNMKCFDWKALQAESGGKLTCPQTPS